MRKSQSVFRDDEVASGQCRNNLWYSEGISSIGVPVAESQQTPSVDTMVQDESVGQGQSEQVPVQPVTGDSESATAVAVLDAPVTEATLESAIVAEGPENSITESVVDAQEPIAEPVDTASVSGSVEAVEEPPTVQESTPEAVTEAPEGLGVPESVAVAQEPQITDSPTTENTVDSEAETIPVSLPGSTESAESSAVDEAAPIEAAAAVSTQPDPGEVLTAVESELSAPLDVVDTAVTEVEQSDTSQDADLDTPPTPVEEMAETKTEEQSPVIELLTLSPIPARAAFLPIESSQNRPGYTLRGLF
jgi:hypothetical protein